MMRKKMRLVALLLAAALLSGCNLIATDPVLDARQIVLEIGPDTVTKGELREVYDASMNQIISNYQANISMYQAFGQSIDPQDASVRERALENAIDALVRNKVIHQQARALELEEFTQEQLEELAPSVDGELEYYTSICQTEYFQDTALEGDELEQAVADKLAELGVTRERILENYREQRVAERVREHAVAGVTVTEEEVAEDYAAKVDEQKESYTENPTAYGDDVLSGQEIYFVPAGYRYVKHVLIQIGDEQRQKISELETELSTLEGTKGDLEAALAGDLDTEIEEDDEEEAPEPEPLTEEQLAEKAQSDERLQAQLDETSALIEGKKNELDALRQEAFDAILPEVQEIQAKIALGLNFDKVIESYGQDTGMNEEPFKTDGYPVVEGTALYDPAFQEASMALAQIGDLSEPVQSAYGYHIIKYMSDSEEHEAGLDAVRDALYDALLSQKQEETYDDALQAWIEATNVKRYAKRIDF